MDDITSRKMAAAAEMALGGVQVISGGLMAAGHGLIGGFLRNHHLMRLAMVRGAHSVNSGVQRLEEGFAAWKEADS